MNNDERRLLSQFLDQLVQTNNVKKDSDANFLIRSALAQQPDAGYLLVQRTLLQDQALHHAKKQIEQLQSEIEHLQSEVASLKTSSPRSAQGASYATKSAGFQGSDAGNHYGSGEAPRSSINYTGVPHSPSSNSALHATAHTHSNSHYPGTASSSQHSSHTSHHPYHAPQYPHTQHPHSARNNQWGGFMANAASTAAGVAGGALLFQGAQSLFGDNDAAKPDTAAAANAASTAAQPAAEAAQSEEAGGFLSSLWPGESSGQGADQGGFFSSFFQDTAASTAPALNEAASSLNSLADSGSALTDQAASFLETEASSFFTDSTDSFDFLSGDDDSSLI